MALIEAFVAMRKSGLIAKMNFSCCSTCGGYELTTKIEEKLEDAVARGKELEKEKEKIKGVVFFHRQDAARRNAGEPFMIRYGDVDSQAFGKVGLDTAEVGVMVMKVLAENGVKATWNGDPNTCIEVAAGQ